MKAKTVVIALLPVRVDLLVLEGKDVVAARRLAIALDNGPEHWASDLRGGVAALKSCVEELGVAGAPAIVLYWSPTQAIEQMSLRLRFARDAVRAGMLAATESLGYAPIEAVCRAAVVARDALPTSRHMHVVTASDREETAAHIVRAVEQAGLRFESATPLEAAVMSRLIASALIGAPAPRAWLHIGETSSFFLVAHDGALRFARRIALGLNTLVTSLTRPVRSSGGRSAIELSRETAERILHECGVPDPDRPANWPEGLTATQLMPLLQPVLERFVVELRQSLRFGVSEADRQGLEIVLTGPGGAVPGLADLLSMELKHAAIVDDRSRGYSFTQPDAQGSEMLCAIEDRSLLARLNVMPSVLAAKRARSRIRRWLWTGAAAAMVMIAIDWLRFEAKLSEAKLQATALAAESTGLDVLRATRDRLVTAVGAMARLEDHIAAEVGARPSVRGILQEVGLLTPSSIRLSDLSLRRQVGGTIGTLRGYAFEDAVADGIERPGLDHYAQLVESSPLFAEVKLHNVQVTSVDGRAALQFELSFLAIPAAPESSIGTAPPLNPRGGQTISGELPRGFGGGVAAAQERSQ